MSIDHLINYMYNFQPNATPTPINMRGDVSFFFSKDIILYRKN